MKEFVEKLIGRLEEKKSEHLYDEKVTQGLGRINLASFCSAKAMALDGAISIVNQLAEEYNNDFCEWKLDGVYLLCQHNTELVISCLEEEKHRYTYCPICGKKIKVVE